LGNTAQKSEGSEHAKRNPSFARSRWKKPTYSEYPIAETVRRENETWVFSNGEAKKAGPARRGEKLRASRETGKGGGFIERRGIKGEKGECQYTQKTGAANSTFIRSQKKKGEGEKENKLVEKRKSFKGA